MAIVSLRSLVQVARAGHPGARVRAVRDGQAALRVAVVHAGLHSGVLAALRTRRTVGELAVRLGASDRELLDAFVRVLVAHGVVSSTSAGYRLTRRGAVVLDDGVVRAGYEAFGGFHGDVYRGLADQLRGGRHGATSSSTPTSSPASRARWIPSWERPSRARSTPPTRAVSSTSAAGTARSSRASSGAHPGAAAWASRSTTPPPSSPSGPWPRRT